MAKLIAFAHEQASEQPIDNHISDDNAAYVGLASGQRSYIPANKAGNIFMNDEQEDVKVAIDSNEDGVFLDSNICDYLNEDTSRVIAVGVTP